MTHPAQTRRMRVGFRRLQPSATTPDPALRHSQGISGKAESPPISGANHFQKALIENLAHIQLRFYH
jgi:hypothetical protein